LSDFSEVFFVFFRFSSWPLSLVFPGFFFPVVRLGPPEEEYQALCYPFFKNRHPPGALLTLELHLSLAHGFLLLVPLSPFFISAFLGVYRSALLLVSFLVPVALMVTIYVFDAFSRLTTSCPIVSQILFTPISSSVCLCDLLRVALFLFSPGGKSLFCVICRLASRFVSVCCAVLFANACPLPWHDQLPFFVFPRTLLLFPPPRIPGSASHFLSLSGQISRFVVFLVPILHCCVLKSLPWGVCGVWSFSSYIHLLLLPQRPFLCLLAIAFLLLVLAVFECAHRSDLHPLLLPLRL